MAFPQLLVIPLLSDVNDHALEQQGFVLGVTPKGVIVRRLWHGLGERLRRFLYEGAQFVHGHVRLLIGWAFLFRHAKHEQCR